MKHKVLAYLLRRHHGRRQVLVFEHRDYPNAGLQVPGGTVEPGEAIQAALWREIREECGLEPERLGAARKLTEVYEAEWDQQRHVFAVETSAVLPDRWRHTVSGRGEDKGMVFNYYWLDVTPSLRLAGGQAEFLALVDAGDVE